MDDVIAVLFTGPCQPTMEDLKRSPVLLRLKKVREALDWLKLNHQDYYDIEISDDNLAEYSEGVPPVAIAYKHAETNKVVEGTSVFDNELEDGTEDGLCPFTVHGLTGSDLEAMHPNKMKAIALRHLEDGRMMLKIGQSIQPESVWDRALYPQMFPWLFPYGLGGIDADFLFTAYSHEQIKSSASRGHLLIEQDKLQDFSALTRVEIVEYLDLQMGTTAQ
ncbi:hypothetical protein BJ165DRAFT_1417677 [Panaeolus papilionaceus]|nr:hypothetical protein BJ165DRAFT_1417677 [Panaeolus papilionaceus]